MGLPQINIRFIHAAQTAVTRSANGIVALLVADDTKEQTSYSYAYAADVDSTAFTAANLAIIKTAFTGSPNRVIIERVCNNDLTAALTRLGNKRFNWLALVGNINADTVATWITEQRAKHKTFKAVLPASSRKTVTEATTWTAASFGVTSVTDFNTVTYSEDGLLTLNATSDSNISVSTNTIKMCGAGREIEFIAGIAGRVTVSFTHNSSTAEDSRTLSIMQNGAVVGSAAAEPGSTATAEADVAVGSVLMTVSDSVNITEIRFTPSASAEVVEVTANWNEPGIVSFNTDNIVCGTVTYSKAQFCPRIAGILAGLPMTRSATYYGIPEADSITESEDPETDISDGHLILIDDGENIKIASETNSYHSLATGDTEDMKSIKTIESMDLIRDDIRTTFENEYIGINNSYDNKAIFVGAVRQYFSELVKEGVLYDEYNNTADIDIEAQRAYLATKYDVSQMSDAEIMTANTGKNVFVTADIQLCDAIENLTFGVLMS